MALSLKVWYPHKMRFGFFWATIFDQGDSGSGSPVDIKRLLSLPREKRERVLQAASSAAVGDYESPEVNISGLVDDTMEYPEET